VRTAPRPRRSGACPVCEAHAESVFRIDGMDCPNEVAILERRLKGVPGIHDLEADVVGRRLRVAHDAALVRPEAIAAAVAETGMRAFPDGDGAPAPEPGARARLILLGLAAVALAAAAGAATAGAPPALVAGLSAAVVATAGVHTGRRAWASVRQRSLDIHVLMTVAVIGALALGDWVEAASVVFLFAVAQWLEARTLERARHAIRRLMDLAPAEATVRRGDSETRVPVDAIAPGDIVYVRPGERIPVDGVVVSGESEVNQAPVTGESLPVDRGAGESVFAGSINGHGALEVRATRAARDSTLARIIHLVERAQASRAPAQAFVDRFARVYTPAVLAVAAAVAVVPPLAGAGPASDWIYRALVLLVIACPCALVISTPVSIVSALAAAARRGVLVKGGVHLERAASIRAVAFDKTGTLTRGRLAVDEVRPLNGDSASAVLAAAASLERGSEHPIGRAIVRHAELRGLELAPATGFRALPGRGAQAKVAGRDVVAGSHRLFHEREWCSPALCEEIGAVEGDGRTAVMVAVDGQPVGVVTVADEARADGRAAVEALRAAGVSAVVMLTGDHPGTAATVAGGLGLDAVHADLMPQDKVRIVTTLRERYGPVAMVGDGVNDAPALAAADLGVAMGAAGSDAALETADVALMGDDLSALAYLVRLSRATLRNIRTNIAVALGLKALFLGLAIAGRATLWMAVFADMGASLIVIANGLRLTRAR
jgi:Cd2+/Zn2+-exporting ATPase